MAATRHSFQPPPSPGDALPKAIACVREAILDLAPGMAGVLIVGERGTRKELAARRIHACSARAHGPFVAVSRPELTEDFIEHELFGSVPGSDRAGGRVEAAQGGVLYLDEVTAFPLSIQARLARLLEQSGAQESERADEGVRLLAAVATDPEESVRQGRLHPGLYDCLRALILTIPPLRDRRAEIVDLAHDLAAAQARALGRPVPRLSGAAISRLVAYDWPGNVRELEQCIIHAAAHARHGVIEEWHLPTALHGVEEPDGTGGNVPDALQSTLECVERALIIEALRATHGNQAKAAQQLGITERLMGLRVKKYGIESRHFRQRDET